ncbi:hypothetical protein HMF8227_00314 [Saliniradius amylolyticus]|uniref:Uncharacterized protein n=1 Tax=Saliniradius amylolyticus TaxID=2183582 RepID=A0A2S2E0K9_9ALTE|nr:hypothetical protein [Saliniradius amylolyticus]AWL10820.1 hypothetical protein HMF8227_00314 [Saliniradius amylolyticus]
MESEGLKQFLEVVGDAVHSVNTICVGLAAVRTGTVTKPDDLTIGWKSSNPETSASKARIFSLRASLVFVEEALLKYLDFLKDCSTEDEILYTALSTEGAADRVVEVSKCLSDAKPYWWPMVVLLVRWRNRVVHSAKNGLTPRQRKLLLEHEQVIKQRHAGIDIQQTLDNFDSSQITLKDFTTLIAITVRYVRALDEQLEPQLHTMQGFISRLEQRGLVEVFDNVMKANGESTRRRKLRSFLDTEFSKIPDTFFEDIFHHGPIRQDNA